MTFDDFIYSTYPNLRNGKGYRETSPCTDDYNCIAYAADDHDNWWWPNIDSYWPPNTPRLETLEAFIEAYRTCGYEPCENGDFEDHFDKIVIYIQAGKPTHAAKQLPSGKWTSKLGRMYDIEHDEFDGIENHLYGKAHQFMKRHKQ